MEIVFASPGDDPRAASPRYAHYYHRPLNNPLTSDYVVAMEAVRVQAKVKDVIIRTAGKTPTTIVADVGDAVAEVEEGEALAAAEVAARASGRSAGGTRDGTGAKGQQ